ncbi:MAG: hypothetical protein RLO17_22070 [Cyclobacteriaceae bacterium]
MKLLLTITCLIFYIAVTFGQPMDSIGFSKVRLQSGKYEINRFGISKIKLKNKPPYRVTDNIAKDEKIVEGVITIFTGWSSSSASEEVLLIENQVKLIGVNKKMDFPVQISGYYEKYRDRVDHEDGSHSMETVETYNPYWDEGAEGLIHENNKTLGKFVFRPVNMVLDSIGYWKSFPGPPPPWLLEKLDNYGNYDAPMDFVVDITLEDQPYTLVYSGKYHQCALIHRQQMIGYWQDAPLLEFVHSWEKRIHPYLLLLVGLSDAEAQQTISLLTLGLSLARNLVN